MLEVCFVVGARPNFVKAAPVIREAASRERVRGRLVHTGQHYDAALSDAFFRDLGMPAPDVSLEVGSGSHAVQTAKVMTTLEPVLVESRPDWVVVFGDVNSTLAGAVVAAKLQIRVAHVEAGLRSFDRTMPEEINRVLTDHAADLLFTTERSGNVNLAREGISSDKVHLVGNTMIDSLLHALPGARDVQGQVLQRVGVKPRRFAALTLHRPANVDEPDRLAAMMGALGEVARELPVVFPVHPRTARNLTDPPPGLVVTEPLPYLEFLALMDAARVVLTDSGGIQEETTTLGVPCLTLRDNTERPSTISDGTNTLVGTDPAALGPAVRRVLDEPVPGPDAPRPPLWDGKAASRILDVFEGLAS